MLPGGNPSRAKSRNLQNNPNPPHQQVRRRTNPPQDSHFTHSRTPTHQTCLIKKGTASHSWARCPRQSRPASSRRQDPLRHETHLRSHHTQNLEQTRARGEAGEVWKCVGGRGRRRGWLVERAGWVEWMRSGECVAWLRILFGLNRGIRGREIGDKRCLEKRRMPVAIMVSL